MKHSAAVLLLFCFGSITTVAAETRKAVSPGLSYEHRTTEDPLSIHILVADPRHLTISAARALNNGVGRETVSSMARRSGAIAAINGGFFQIGGRYDGDPSGLLMVAQRWFSDSVAPRGAIGWREAPGLVLIGWPTAVWRLETEQTLLPVLGINRARPETKAVLYTWAFHRSTLTDPGGLEAQIADGKVVALDRSGDSPIPPEGYVYSAGPKFPAHILEHLKVGAAVKPRVFIREEGTDRAAEWEAMDHVMGGAPVLIRDKRVIESFESEKVARDFLQKRHPRTAVGIRQDGTWVMAVVDGRQKALSLGMTMSELAALMASLECVEAINLDGGGSSTLVLEGEVLNSPSDSGVERPVSDAILVLKRSSGQP